MIRPAAAGLAIGLTLTLVSCALPSRQARTLADSKSLAHALRAAEAPHLSELKRDREVARVVATMAKRQGSVPADIDLHWIGRSGIDPLSFERVVPSRLLSHRRWRREWIAYPGAGTPLILLRDAGRDRFVGKIGEALPVTAVVETAGERPQLQLYDLLDPENASSHLTGPPLARDYTAPLAYLLRRDELVPELRGLIRAGRYLDDLGLYRLDPYDPNKIPVILIHGLKSSAQVWVNLFNELHANPDIRARYQFWTFSYPTGVPILYSAMRLRAELQSMRAHYDPSGSNPNLDKMVLVGHSMGGILARLMISPSSDRLTALLPKPIEDLKLPPDLSALANEMMIFEPQPYIGRAVFIAAPHRGSDVAGLKIVRRASGLIRVPRELRSAVLTALSMNPDLALIPDATIDQLNSVANLRPDSRFMRAMGGNTIASGYPYHSIIAIGKNSNGEPLEEANDSLVRYPSAHLEGAKSELTVAGPHKVFDDPRTIAEVARILELHR